MKINDPVQSWSRLFHAAAAIAIVVESESYARVWKNSFLIALTYLVNAKVIRSVKKVPSTDLLCY